MSNLAAQYRFKQSLQAMVSISLNYNLLQALVKYLHRVASVGIPSRGGPFYLRGLTLIPAWCNNHTPSKAWDKITYLSPNFKSCTVEFW